MSEENVELARETFDAFNRGDLEGVLDRLAPDFEMHPSGRWLDMQRVYRGREGWTDFWDTFQEAWESITVNVERIEDLGDRGVLVLGNFYGRGRGSGVEATVEVAWLGTSKDGFLVGLRTFASWERALEAAGLSE